MDQREKTLGIAVCSRISWGKLRFICSEINCLIWEGVQWFDNLSAPSVDPLYCVPSAPTAHHVAHSSATACPAVVREMGLLNGQDLPHRENGGALGMVPFIINPIYTLYIVGIYCISPLKTCKGLFWLNSWGPPPFSLWLPWLPVYFKNPRHRFYTFLKKVFELEISLLVKWGDPGQLSEYAVNISTRHHTVTTFIFPLCTIACAICFSGFPPNTQTGDYT